MIQATQLSLLFFSILIAAGGVVGFLKASSKASLVTGLISGSLVLCCYSMSRRNPQTGFLLASVICTLLIVVFAIRLAKTKKFMPSGMLLTLSALETLLLILTLNSPA